MSCSTSSLFQNFFSVESVTESVVEKACNGSSNVTVWGLFAVSRLWGLAPEADRKAAIRSAEINAAVGLAFFSADGSGDAAVGEARELLRTGGGEPPGGWSPRMPAFLSAMLFASAFRKALVSAFREALASVFTFGAKLIFFLFFAMVVFLAVLGLLGFGSRRLSRLVWGCGWLAKTNLLP